MGDQRGSELDPAVAMDAKVQPMDIIEIPTMVILEAMLGELQPPRPTYRICKERDEAVTITVMFYPTTNSLQHNFGHVSLTSRPSTNERAAENEVLAEAIKYIQTCQKKMLKDLNYARLKQKEDSDECLLRQVIEKNRKIRQLCRAWASFIDDMSAPSEQIQKIIRANLSEPETDLDGMLSSILLEVDKAAIDLEQFTFQATEMLQTIGTYPYHSESELGEGDQFLGYYGSEDEYHGKNTLDDEPFYDTDD